ncbi:unnamed protein product [Citrullus colocynthis]|uniref:Uncharacterized protein n=1 Tax=Citrullus colocynthis TaxID=252529 RepID=A0ABP0Z8N9_9ROSI
MSQKSFEKHCVDEVVEIDGLKSEGPWSDKNEALFVDLMDEEVVNKRAKKFLKNGCPHYANLMWIFGDTTATGVNACPSTKLLSDFEDENDVGNVYAENAKRKNDILEKRTHSSTARQVDEGQSLGEKDVDEELMKCFKILNTMEDIDGEAYTKVLKLLHGDLAWRKLFLLMHDARKKDFINSI